MKRALHAALVAFAALIGVVVGAFVGVIAGLLLAPTFLHNLAVLPAAALAIVGALLVAVPTAMSLRGASNAECGRVLRQRLLRPVLLLVFLGFAPGIVIRLLFPWRLGWGDAVLIDLGPVHDYVRFGYEFGDVTLRQGEQLQWRLPAVPGRGLMLDVGPLQQALAGMPGSSVVLAVEDVRGRRECTVRGSRESRSDVLGDDVYDVITVPRSERPVTISLCVDAPGVSVPAVVPLRAYEYSCK